MIMKENSIRMQGVRKISGEKGSRCDSGATAITVFCDADADVIERKLEKAQPQEHCSTQSARRPALDV